MKPKASILRGQTALITGGRTGVGFATARELLFAGANVVIVGTTGEPHPKKQGTIFSAAEELSNFGEVVGVCCDVQDANQCQHAVEAALRRFGGLDILVNDAGALDNAETENADPRRVGLVFKVNPVGSFNMTWAALPALRKSKRPRVLNITPPLGEPGRAVSRSWLARWVGSNPAYTASKFAMSLLTLGWSWEFRNLGFSVSGLWFESILDTPALSKLPNPEFLKQSARTAEIGADAALAMLAAPRSKVNGKLLLDVQALQDLGGVCRFDRYGREPGKKLVLDWYVDRPLSACAFWDRAELAQLLAPVRAG